MLNTANTRAQLASRLDCNQSGRADLNEFAFGLMQPGAEDRVLDVGCGLGKQLVPLSERVAQIVGVDVSEELISALREQVGQRDGVELRIADMDALDGLDLGAPFDLVYSVYALYYSADVARLVAGLAGRLVTSTGRLFVMAPDVGNNANWFADLQELFELPQEILESSLVSRRTILPAILDNFDDVSCHRFRNEVRFASLEDLLAYYRGCGSYCDPAREADAADRFRRHFEESGEYVIEKRALGILATHVA